MHEYFYGQLEMDRVIANMEKIEPYYDEFPVEITTPQDMWGGRLTAGELGLVGDKGHIWKLLQKKWNITWNNTMTVNIKG